jgi:hypothetical protein
MKNMKRIVICFSFKVDKVSTIGASDSSHVLTASEETNTKWGWPHSQLRAYEAVIFLMANSES